MQLVVFPIKIEMHLNVKLTSESEKTLYTKKQLTYLSINVSYNFRLLKAQQQKD